MRHPVPTSSPEWNAWVTLANDVSTALRTEVEDFIHLGERTNVAAWLWENGWRPTAEQIAAEVARQHPRKEADQ